MILLPTKENRFGLQVGIADFYQYTSYIKFYTIASLILKKHRMPQLGRSIVLPLTWRRNDVKVTLWCHAHFSMFIHLGTATTSTTPKLILLVLGRALDQRERVSVCVCVRERERERERESTGQLLCTETY